MARLRPGGIDSETSWVIDAVPAERTFRVDENVAVRINLTHLGTDLVVYLRAGGKEVATADDPEVIESRLSPGTYTVRAEAYSRNSMSLSPAARLVVRIDKP